VANSVLSFRLWGRYILGRVALQPGTHRLGPDNATLSVRTRRVGAAAKAGHDLLLRVKSWDATLVVGEDHSDTSMRLSADSTSLHVVEGTGGIQELREDDVANIEQTIDDEVLKRRDIEFTSTRVSPSSDGRLHAEGRLTLAGTTAPIGFDLATDDDGTMSARAVVTQTDWGVKPYTALWGALKVADDVEVVLEGRL
jgi:polyisoprenoid-binding protein YceI